LAYFKPRDQSYEEYRDRGPAEDAYSLIDEFTNVWEPPDINIIVGDRIKLDGQKEPKDES